MPTSEKRRTSRKADRQSIKEKRQQKQKEETDKEIQYNFETPQSMNIFRQTFIIIIPAKERQIYLAIFSCSSLVKEEKSSSSDDGFFIKVGFILGGDSCVEPGGVGSFE